MARFMNLSRDYYATDDCYGHYESWNSVCSQCGWKNKCENVVKMLKSDNQLDVAIAEMEMQSGPEFAED